MRDVLEEAKRLSVGRATGPSASVGQVGETSERSQEGAWRIVGKVLDRCVRLRHYGLRPV